MELKRERRRAVLNKILAAVSGLVAIFLLLAYLSRFNSLNIAGVEVSGNKIVDTEMIREAAGEQIAGKYLWLFPKTNILIYPENNIRKNLQNKFQRLKDINLSVSNDKILQVSVMERAASYIWCGTNLPSADTGSPKCYFMDADGYIFDEAPYFSGEVYFKFYGGTSINAESPFGSYFFQKNFRQLMSFKDTLIAVGLKPVALYAAADGDLQIFLSGGKTPAAEPKILLRADADLQNAAENLQAALNTEPLLSKFKNKYSKLEYIDLRFGNKVYDKFLP